MYSVQVLQTRYINDLSTLVINEMTYQWIYIFVQVPLQKICSFRERLESGGRWIKHVHEVLDFTLCITRKNRIEYILR